MVPLGIKNGRFILEICLAVEVTASMVGLGSMYKQQLGSRNGQREMYAIKTFLVSTGQDGLTTL